jgi:hypothetical protein
VRVGVGVVELFQCFRCEGAYCIFQLLNCWLDFSDYVGDCVSVFAYLLLDCDPKEYGASLCFVQGLCR